MDKYLFTDKEKQKIIDALKIQKNILQEDCQLLIQKLENLKGDNEISNTFSFHSPTIHRKEIENDIKIKINALKKAISLKKKVKINYISLNGEITNRVISPYKINLNDGSWYLESYCEIRNDRRLFKLTRIREYLLLDETFNISLEKENVLTSCYELVELIFQRNQLGKLYDFFLEEEIEIHEDSIKVTFNYDSNRNLLPFLLMFSSSVEVIKPLKLKNEYYFELNKIYKKINDDR